MTVRNLSVAAYLTDGANQPYPTGDVVTIVDSSTNLANLTAVQIASFGTNHVDAINSTDDVLSWDVQQWQAVPTGLSFDASDLKVVFDTGADLATLTTTDLGNLNTYGVTLINPQDGVASFTVAQYQALGGISIDQGADVTLADTGSHIQGMSAAEIGALSIKGFDVIDASNNGYNLTADQALALSGVTLDASDTVTLTDTSAHIEALSASDFATIANAGLADINATDDVLTLTDAQYSAITNNGMTLTGADDVTLADAGATIAAHDFNTLSVNGIDNIDATDDAMSISVNQANELIAGDVVASDSADVITLLDTAFNIANNLSSLDDLGEAGVDAIDLTGGAGLGLTAAQYDSLASQGVVLSDPTDEFDILDSTANIEAITSGELGGYITQGIDFIDAISGSGAYSWDKTAADSVLASGLIFAGNDVVTLADTGANIAGYTAAQLTSLKGHGFDGLDATNDVLNLDVAQYGGLSGLTLAAGDTVTILDTGANVAGMSVGTIGGLAAANVDAIDASDNTLTISLAQFNALGAVSLTLADAVTVADTGAAFAGVSAVAFGLMGEKGVDKIDATDDKLFLNVAQTNVLATAGEIGLTASDVVTLSDTGANLAAVAAATYTTFGANGVDKIDAGDNAVSFTVAQVNAIIGANISLTASDVVTLADTSVNIDALTGANITAYNSAGVDVIDSTQNGTLYSVDVAGARALEAGAIHLASGDTTALADTAANISGLSATEISGLFAEGIDGIDATDNAVNLTVAQALALGELGLAAGDTVSIVDTGANLATLTTGQLDTLDAKGVDFLDASDNALNLSVAQYQHLGEIGLTAADTVSLLDTGATLAGLSDTVLAGLGGDQIDFIDASDDALSLSIVQLDALDSGETGLVAGDVVTLSDLEASIEGLSAGELGGYSGQGVDLIHASNTGILNMSAAQVGAVADGAISFKASDAVTLSDTGAHIAGLSDAEFAAMAADNVDTIDASDNALSLTVAQYRGIAGSATHLTGADTVTLVDTGANLASLSAAEIAALAANNVDRLNASDNVLKLNVAQFNALGTVTLAGGDVVSLTDTGANLATLNFSSLAGKNVDAIDATDNLLTLSYSQFSSLGSVSLAAGDTVTLADTSTVIQGLTGSQMLSLGGKGIDIIDTTDNILQLSLTQFNNLGAVVVAANDVFTILDTGANLANVGGGKINQFNTAGVDFIDSSTGVWNMSAAAAGALADGAAKAVGADAVSVFDTGANIAGLTAGEIGALGAHNVDSLDASDDTLALSTGQFNALGTVTLTGADDVTIADTDALLGTLNFSQLAGKGVDHLDSTNGTLHLTVAQYSALGTVTLTGADTVTLSDSSANLQSLTAVQIAQLDNNGVDFLDSTSDLLTLNKAQFDALGETGLTLSDVVTIADTGANLATIDASEVIDLVNRGVDRIDATDGSFSLAKSVIDDLKAGNVALTQTDTVTMTAGEASLEALTAGQLATYAAYGVDFIDSASDFNILDASQVAAMANTGLKEVGSDFLLLEDSSANVIANLGALFGSLASTGVDLIDLTDDGVNLTVAQATALGPVSFDSSDNNVVVLDSGANISALTASQISSLGESGVDSLDATDDSLTLNVDQFDRIVFSAEMGLTAGDNITLADTGAHIASLSQSEIKQLTALGIDQVTLTDHQITLNYGQYKSFTHDFAFSSLDTVTAKGTEGNNSLTGGDEKDIFDGRGGNDTIDGGRGADTITGGLGSDVLTGGIGSDHFVFTSLADSTVGAADRITDLTNIDVIDLSLIDADSTVDGDQAFHEVKKFTGHAGEMMVKYSSGSGLTLIKLDVDGDGHADAQIAIDGDHHSFDNFVL